MIITGFPCTKKKCKLYKEYIFSFASVENKKPKWQTLYSSGCVFCKHFKGFNLFVDKKEKD